MGGVASMQERGGDMVGRSCREELSHGERAKLRVASRTR